VDVDVVPVPIADGGVHFHFRHFHFSHFQLTPA
jgi:hypothetical protein